MWVIRKISPWQERDRFYPIGNPIVFASVDKNVLLQRKNELEVEQLRKNPLPNLWDYWDVDSSKEMIKLNKYLIQNHDFPILVINPEDENYTVLMDDIIHGQIPDDKFTDNDLIKLQDYIGIYYYKIDKLTEIGKYTIVVNPNLDIDTLQSMEYKIFETGAEGIDYLKRFNEKSGLQIVQIKE